MEKNANEGILVLQIFPLKTKKHSSTSPDVQFEKFLLTKQKVRPSRTMSELGKPFIEKTDKKI